MGVARRRREGNVLPQMLPLILLLKLMLLKVEIRSSQVSLGGYCKGMMLKMLLLLLQRLMLQLSKSRSAVYRRWNSRQNQLLQARLGHFDLRWMNENVLRMLWLLLQLLGDVVGNGGQCL